MDGFLWHTDVLTYIRDAVQYFQLNYVINNGDSNVNVIILYIVFGLMLFVLLLVAGVIYKISTSKKTTSTFLTYSIKILSLFALLLTSIATLPFYNIFISFIYCNSNNPASAAFTCYSGIYFLHLIIAVVGIILLTAYSLMFTMLYIDLNPSSAIPFAAPQSRLNLYRLVLKVLILVYVIIDFKGTLAKQYISVLAALYLILLIMRYRTTPYYNSQVQLFVVSTESALLWVSLCVVVQAVRTECLWSSLICFLRSSSILIKATHWSCSLCSFVSHSLPTPSSKSLMPVNGLS
jgi:hypothetical protein